MEGLQSEFRSDESNLEDSSLDEPSFEENTLEVDGTVCWKDIFASPRRDGTISTGLDTVFLNLA